MGRTVTPKYKVEVRHQGGTVQSDASAWRGKATDAQRRLQVALEDFVVHIVLLGVCVVHECHAYVVATKWPNVMGEKHGTCTPVLCQVDK